MPQERSYSLSEKRLSTEEVIALVTERTAEEKFEEVEWALPEADLRAAFRIAYECGLRTGVNLGRHLSDTTP